ncbi:adenylate/guanylate cyclase domain-containing protein [Bdellovibrio reynosensis]|uniref:Adenylate/guanylate cyclase domain-containing protein n=1 Tax=Bdellovibrio reynosensis TaxID=2835041 RepID=A0ABY4CCW6_9BACT|nr:adenylate/guanylate cyclase domain-containing protein [Bdellovibrio reynosensis]UOF00040.1 adenylate/guanylate cyclase domain-containing protein [Bdellovibrio reynosensis]
MKTEKISYLIGSGVTLLFVFLAFQFYNYQNLRHEEQDPKSFVGVLENLDLKMLDFKMQLRGSKPSEAKVGLIAIDDKSIEEVGRWPWDRKVIAKLVDNVFADGASSLGFDVIFSEPQFGDPSSDMALAESLTKHRDKVVTGSFNEPAGDAWAPYQDYCVNEAFARANGADVVKLNASFVVEDKADPYESIDFGQLLNQLFTALEAENVPLLLKNEFKVASEAELSDAQKRFMKIEVTKRNFEYCQTWLTSNDPFVPTKENPELVKAYAEIFAVPEKDLESAVKKFKKTVLRHPLPASWSWSANLPMMQAGVDYNASFNAFQDNDGSVRRMPLFYRTGNRMGTSFVPTLSLQTYLTGMGYRAQVTVDKTSNSKNKVVTAFDVYDPKQEPEKKMFSISADKFSFMRVNYYGGTYSIPHIPAREILRNSPTIKIIHTFWHPESQKFQPKVVEVDRKEFFKDRMLIMGATATGVYDLRVTPFEKNFPGPEIHVQALAQLADHKFLSPWSKEAKLMPWIILALGIFLSVVLTQVGAVPGLIISATTLAVIVATDLFLFLKFNIMISIMLPLLVLVIVNFAIQTYKYLTEEKKKKELKTTFAKYVSPAIVDEVLKSPENLELGGKKQRMTVFFSDVRGFTTLSESLDPQKLSEILSRYLTPMTDIVFKNRGTLDKYMGDALMAFFGAPIAYDGHAKEACRTALQSLVKLKELQEEFKKEGIPTIDIGIGINTGEMSVGNMGSTIVRNYTVMGDAVNLGSRLEGINKEYGTRIIISEFTYGDVKDAFVCREVDMVKVKGKNLPVKIFELVAEGQVDKDHQERLSTFEKAYRDYQEMNFKNALEAFETLDKNHGDPVAAIYVERCQEFLENPPPQDWDRVFVMTKK